ncbi:YtxH domain-containing protein [Coprobacter sp.]
MGTKNSNLWIGLGIGSVIGALIYRFSCSPKGKKLKNKINHALYQIEDQAEELFDNVKEKAWDKGSKIKEKIKDGAQELAENKEKFNEKIHSLNADIKK